MTSEQVLAWEKGVKAQGAQSVVINSLSEIKEFNKIQTVTDEHKKNETKSHTSIKIPATTNC